MSVRWAVVRLTSEGGTSLKDQHLVTLLASCLLAEVLLLKVLSRRFTGGANPQLCCNWLAGPHQSSVYLPAHDPGWPLRLHV